MIDINFIIWLFPILFIFHDFEEIILIEGWISRNINYLENEYPKAFKKLSNQFRNITTASFALGVFEEFILISAITITAYLTNWYYLWIGAFISFTLHLIIHCFQSIVIRKYIPALFTSIIALPICIHIIISIAPFFNVYQIFMYTLLSFIIMIFNLILVHHYINKFNKI